LATSIEHVGSTSVPGLAAKPVVDLDIVIPTPCVIVSEPTRKIATAMSQSNNSLPCNSPTTSTAKSQVKPNSS